MMQPETINQQYTQAYVTSSLKIWDTIAVGGILIFGNAIWIGIFCKILLLSCVGVLGLLITSVAAIAALQNRRLGNPSILVYPQPAASDNSPIAFSVPVARKYWYEIITFASLIFLAIGLFSGIITFVFNAPNFKPDYYYAIAIVAAVGCGALAGLFTVLIQSIRELNLYKITKNKEIEIADGELRISLALLEGKHRADLRKQNMPFIRIALKEIKEFSVEAAGHYRNESTPSYYVVSTSMLEKTYILRRYLKGIEADFLEKLRTHLRIPITVKDTLR